MLKLPHYSCTHLLQIPTTIQSTIFTARRYASTVHAVVVCPSVCPSIRLSQASIGPKRLNAGSHKKRHMIAKGLWFSDAKDLSEIPTGSPSTGRQIEVG